MSDLNTRLRSAVDRQRWRARGSSFAAKLKATQAVWFPPETAKTATKTGKKAAKKTTRTTKKAGRKATRASGG
jgi:hypothetical protein